MSTALRKYFAEPGNTQEGLAKTLNVRQATVSRWASGHIRIPAERVLDIEAATGGFVTRYELRPDIYPVDAA